MYRSRNREVLLDDLGGIAGVAVQNGANCTAALPQAVSSSPHRALLCAPVAM